MIPGVKGLSIGLLVAAHGERREVAANENVVRLAKALSARNLVSEVGVGFIKGTPTIGEALRAFAASKIIVYPFFASDGYFTRDRLVQLLDEAEASNASRTVQVLPPLGLDPGLTVLIAEQAATGAREHGFVPGETALVLIAHGSRRNSSSRSATERIAEGVRQQGLFRTVGIALLEEPPFVRESLRDISGPILAVGLFSGDGMHGAGDAPRLIAELGRHNVVFAGNIGKFEGVEQLVAAAVTRTLTATARRSPIQWEFGRST